MIVLLSPAKIQNFKKDGSVFPFSFPKFMSEAEQLIQLMRKKDPIELAGLLEINQELTQLNFDRIFRWEIPFTTTNSRQAALVFDGEASRGLNFTSFSKDEINRAQQKLRIMSGLYGILKPLDLIQPYRLDVGTKMSNSEGKDMYAFWKKKITKNLADELSTLPESDKFILNLTSSEYSKAVNFKELKVPVINPEFYEYKNDKLKQIVVYTKKARGMMAAFAIRENIKSPEHIQAFTEGGYFFDPTRSSDNNYVFIR